MVIDKLAIADMGTTKASKALNNVAPRPEEHQNPPAGVTSVTETATKDRWDARGSVCQALTQDRVVPWPRRWWFYHWSVVQVTQVVNLEPRGGRGAAGSVELLPPYIARIFQLPRRCQIDMFY